MSVCYLRASVTLEVSVIMVSSYESLTCLHTSVLWAFHKLLIPRAGEQCYCTMSVCLHSPFVFIGHLMLSKHGDMPVKIILSHLYAYGTVSAWIPKSLYNRCQTQRTESKCRACAVTELPIISQKIVFSSNFLYLPDMQGGKKPASS